MKKHISKNITIGEAKFTIDTKDLDSGSLEIEIIDDGGGHFVAINTGGAKVRLDPDELIAIAAWAKDMCIALDGEGNGP